MKLLTIVVPCYQSQDYMRNCIGTLLGGGDDVEILIVNDGSTDGTGIIADELQAAHPAMIRAIHQENRGHGGAVMTGIRNAVGQYVKVVDSDDWLEEDALRLVLLRLKELHEARESVDAVFCNYVYEKAGAKHKKVVNYQSVFPEGRLCTWEDAGSFRLGKYILMHSVIYRTQLLRDSGLDLPRNTFYVDNLFVYQPMPFVKTILYLDLDLYHYFIGRADQSVNEKVMIGRIDQQILVNKLMLRCCDLQSITPRKLRHSMCRYMEIVTMVSTVLLFRDGSPESLFKKKALWNYIRETDPWFYAYLSKRSLMGALLKHDGLFFRKVSLFVYRLCQALIGFN